MRDNLIDFWRKRWIWIIFLAALIVLFSFYLIFYQDKPTTFNQNSEVNLLNKTNQEIQNTNNLLNQSLNNQEVIGRKLDEIIFNQRNSSGNKQK